MERNLTNKPLFAHYTNGRKGSHELRITTDIEARDVIVFQTVFGRKDARAIAARFNAQPWNF